MLYIESRSLIYDRERAHISSVFCSLPFQHVVCKKPLLYVLCAVLKINYFEFLNFFFHPLNTESLRRDIERIETDRNIDHWDNNISAEWPQ